LLRPRTPNGQSKSVSGRRHAGSGGDALYQDPERSASNATSSCSGLGGRPRMTASTRVPGAASSGAAAAVERCTPVLDDHPEGDEPLSAGRVHSDPALHQAERRAQNCPPFGGERPCPTSAWEAGSPLTTAVSRPRSGVVLLWAAGEVDSTTASRLDDGLTSAFDAALGEPAGTVVVDLSGVTFLASSGLAVLVRGARRAAERAQRLHVVVASRAVARPLQVTRTDVLIDTHSDVGSALDAAGAVTVAPHPDE
jgi:anti-sigma B factor antagonist